MVRGTVTVVTALLPHYLAFITIHVIFSFLRILKGNGRQGMVDQEVDDRCGCVSVCLCVRMSVSPSHSLSP